MRWKIIAGCTAAALCLCAVLWLTVQQQESASGAANLLHIYSDQQDADTTDPTTGGVQPDPPDPHRENDTPSKTSGTQSKPVGNTTNPAPSDSAAPSQQEPSTPTTTEGPAEPSVSTTPEATFSIIGSEGGVTATLEEGDTVYSVTEKMMENYPLPDFDYGKQGLWEYSVNGETSDVPADQYIVENGDVLEWHPVFSQPSTDTDAPSTSAESENESTSEAAPSTPVASNSEAADAAPSASESSPQ